jgi:hypothetical protein
MSHQLPDFNRFNKIFQEAAENIAAIQKEIEIATKPLREFTQSFASDLNEIAEGIKAASNDIERFKVIIVDIGYPPHEDLEILEMRRIVHYFDKYGYDRTQKYVNELFLKVYNREKILDLFSKWTNMGFLKNRIHILKEGVESHISKKFFSSIPTIMPQIEGIIVENFQHTGMLKSDKLKQYVKTLLDDEMTLSFDKAIQLFYFNIILGSFTHGDNIESTLSRHAILHGADVSYGTEINSLKCILLLDYLVEKIYEVGNKKEQSVSNSKKALTSHNTAFTHRG